MTTTPEAGMRLAPCPFCGGAGRLTFGTYELDAGNHVVCEGRKDCPMFCSTPYRVHDTRAEAITAWNTRAAALRRAFPEEIGNEYAAEEVEGQAFGVRDVTARNPFEREERKAAQWQRGFEKAKSEDKS